MNPDIQPALRYVDLSGYELNSVDQSGADLRGVNLSQASLSGANLSDTNLSETNLSRANLESANLSLAKLDGAKLNAAILSGTDLSDANLNNILFGSTTFQHLDFRTTKGLATIHHLGPSPIHLPSIQLPQDGSTLHFLRGVGLTNAQIDLWRTETMDPIQYYSVFITYNSNDIILARRLHADLQASGVRCWFAPEDLKIGDKIRPRINEAIHLQDKLLLLLSEHSIASTWVENEVETALEKEDRQKREVLFPVRLDDAVLQTSQAWAVTFFSRRNWRKAEKRGTEGQSRLPLLKCQCHASFCEKTDPLKALGSVASWGHNIFPCQNPAKPA